MTGKYAVFIWSCYALTALVLLWNILSPRLTRAIVMRRLAETDEQAGGMDE